MLANHCLFSGSSLERFDLQGTKTVVNGSELTPRTTISSSAGCGMTNHPNGRIYTNTSLGAIALNADTGAKTLGPFGPGGKALGIAVDPQTNDLVYVGSSGTLVRVNADLTSSSTFSSALSGHFLDGIFFDPTGDFLFVADRTVASVAVIARSGTLRQSISLGPTASRFTRSSRSSL